MSGTRQTAGPNPPRPVGISSPAVKFRKAIGEALEGGAEPRDLLLKMTLSDANRLMRDPETPVADIAFADGGMTFIGVKVQRGGVSVSVLGLLSDEPEPVVEEPVVKKKKAPAKKKVVAAAATEAE